MLALGAADRAAAASVLDVNWGDGCGPATCFNARGGYSLTFSAAGFGGPVDVSKLLLGRSVLGSMDGHFFSVSFELNGHQVGSWGDWNVGAVGGDELSLFGPDLMWNPADGDLVLVLQLVNATGQAIDVNGLLLDPTAGGGGWFSGGNSAIDPGDGPSGGGGGSDLDVIIPPNPPGGGSPGGDGPVGGNPPPPGGGVTTPPGDSRAAVPEPSAWALMIAGLGLTGSALRRRRDAAAVRIAS
jgi:hypothetical protein